jgi:hypothetical protein
LAADFQTKGDAMPKIISAENLYKRINRKLRPRGEQLKRSRGQSVEATLGLYYVLDLQRNFIVETSVQLESLAQDLGVLYPGEGMES